MLMEYGLINNFTNTGSDREYFITETMESNQKNLPVFKLD